MKRRHDRFETSGDVVTQRECSSCAKHRAKHRSCFAKVSGTNLRQGRCDEILVAASRRALDQNSTRHAINELLVSCRHRLAVAIRRSIIEDASPPRRVESNRRSENDILFYSRTRFYFQSIFSDD